MTQAVELRLFPPFNSSSVRSVTVQNGEYTKKELVKAENESPLCSEETIRSVGQTRLF